MLSTLPPLLCWLSLLAAKPALPAQPASAPNLQISPPDTTRMARQAVQLAEVRVRPGATITVSTVGPKSKKDHGSLIIPGEEYATLVRAAPGTATGTLEKITIQFSRNKASEGRIRVRLLNVAAGPEQLPGTTDLLATAPIYSAAQLAALPGGLLTIELAAAGIRLPAEGICVLLEGLATRPEEQCVIMRRDDPTPWQILVGTDPTNPATQHRVAADLFPAITTISSLATTLFWVRHCGHSEWKLHRPGAKGRATSAAITLTLRPD